MSHKSKSSNPVILSKLPPLLDRDSEKNTYITEQSQTVINFTGVNNVSRNLDKANLHPENEKRPCKALRHDIYALASSYETFHSALAATVSNLLIIGRKFSFVSTTKPPNTRKLMARYSESDDSEKQQNFSETH